MCAPRCLGCFPHPTVSRPQYWGEILDRIEDGSFSAQFMVSHRVPIECVGLARLDLMSQRLPGSLQGLPGPRRRRREGLRACCTLASELTHQVETQFSSPPGKGYPQMTRVADWPTK